MPQLWSSLGLRSSKREFSLKEKLQSFNYMPVGAAFLQRILLKLGSDNCSLGGDVEFVFQGVSNFDD